MNSVFESSFGYFLIASLSICLLRVFSCLVILAFVVSNCSDAAINRFDESSFSAAILDDVEWPSCDEKKLISVSAVAWSGVLMGL